MAEMDVLRPYLDRLVDDVLARVPERPAALRARRRGRLRVVLVAVLVIAVIVIAGLLARVSTSSRSEDVPPAERPSGAKTYDELVTPAEQLRECIASFNGSGVPPGTTFGVIDVGTGTYVTMAHEDYCRGQVEAIRSIPYRREALADAGLSPQVVFREGSFVVQYAEVHRDTRPDGSVVDIVSTVTVPPQDVDARAPSAKRSP